MDPYFNLSEIPSFPKTEYKPAFNELNSTMCDALRKIEYLQIHFNSVYQEKLRIFNSSVEDQRFTKGPLDRSLQSAHNIYWIQQYVNNLMPHFQRLETYLDQVRDSAQTGYSFTINYAEGVYVHFQDLIASINSLVATEIQKLQKEIEFFDGRTLSGKFESDLEGKKNVKVSCQLLTKNIETISEKFREIYEVNQDKISYFNSWYQPSQLLVDLSSQSIPLLQTEESEITPDAMTAPIMQTMTSEMKPILLIRMASDLDSLLFVQTYSLLPDNTWATMGPVIDGACREPANLEFCRKEVSEVALNDIYLQLLTNGFVQTFFKETGKEGPTMMTYSLV